MAKSPGRTQSKQAAPVPTRTGAVASALMWAAVVAAFIAAAAGYTPWRAFPIADLPETMLGVCAIAVSLASLAAGKAIRGFSRNTLLVAGGLLLSLILSTAFTPWWSYSVFGTPMMRLGLITVVPALGVMLLVSRSAEEMRGLLYAAAPWASGLCGAVVLAQAASGSSDLHGPSSNAAVLAQLLLLLLPLTSAAVAAKWGPRLLVGLSHVVLLAVVGAETGLVIALAWTAFDQLVVRGVISRVPRKTLLWIPGALLALSLAVVLLGSAVGELPLAGRRTYWRVGAQLVEASPLLGHGLSAYQGAAAAVITAGTVPPEPPDFSTTPHALLLDITTSTGVVGLLAVLLSAVYLTSRWSTEPTSRGFGVSAGLVMYACTLLVQPLWLESVPLLALMIGASVCVESPPDVTGTGLASTRVVQVATLVLGSIALLHGISYVTLSLQDARLASAASIERSASAWRWDSGLWAAAAIKHAGEYAGSPSQASMEGAESASRMAISLVSGEPQYRYGYAKQAEIFGFSPDVIQTRYEEALAAYPFSAQANRAYGLFRARSGDLEGARTTYVWLKTHYPTWSGTVSYRQEIESSGADTTEW